MAISKIQTGDNVKVVSGAFRGHAGRVVSVNQKKDQRGRLKVRASVSGVAQLVKYRKANRTQNAPGSKKMIDRSIDISNLMLVDDKGNPSKSKIEEKDGKKFRSYKTTGSQVVKEKVIKTSDQITDELIKEDKKKIKAPKLNAKKVKSATEQTKTPRASKKTVNRTTDK